MTNEIALQDRFVLQQEVVTRFIKGESETSIAKSLKMRRVDVKGHLDEWREVAVNNPAIQDRAREALAAMDQHYNMILEKLWSAHDEADLEGDYKAKTTTLKTIADVEAKRQETLQKAGLLDDAAIGEQLAEAEEKFEAIKQLLKEVVNDCPRCRVDVQKGLRKIFGNEDEPIVVSAEPGDFEVHDHI